jgi:exportin-1
MTLQPEETQPFILTLIADLGRHIKDLQVHQVQSFYESVACMLSDKGDAIELPREEVVVCLMEIQNHTWKVIYNMR